MTENFLVKVFEHNNWANLRIVEACAALSDEQQFAASFSSRNGSWKLKRLPRYNLFFVEKRAVPVDVMLARYSVDGTYTDCYTAEVHGEIFLAEFIYAFYTTFLFKLERFILKWTVAEPSADADARELADQARDKFAAWHVEDRSQNEILMCDFLGRTRSWLMVKPVNLAGETGTRLYFGTAVVPIRNSKRGEPSLEFGFRALLFGFHQIYSVLLLTSAKSRIQRSAHEKQKSRLPIDG